MASLQDQLLNAGLVDEKAAKKARKEKSKQKKVAYKSKQKAVDDTRLAAEKALADKAERNREQNRILQEQAEKKAIEAQIIQLITINKLDRSGGDIGYNFADGTIKKIFVTKTFQDQLSLGRLAIVKLKQGNEVRYEIVAKAVADKIAQRDKSFIVLLNEGNADKQQGKISEEDDWYADYEIPDDLMW